MAHQQQQSRGMAPKLPEGVELSRDGKTLSINIPGTAHQIEHGQRVGQGEKSSPSNPLLITADGDSPLKVKTGKDGHITVTSKTDDGKTNTYEFTPEKRSGGDRPTSSQVGNRFEAELPSFGAKNPSSGAQHQRPERFEAELPSLGAKQPKPGM